MTSVKMEEDTSVIVNKPDCKDPSSIITLKTDSDIKYIKEEKHDILLVRPKKRQRSVFEGVVVPTLGLIIKRKKEEAEDHKKLKLLHNPKIKKTTDGPSRKLLRDRMKPIGLEVLSQYITIDKVSQEATVSRQAMSKRYGGNMQSTWPKIHSQFLALHGMDNFMYVNNEMQPVAPIVPCAPGLFINKEGSKCKTGTMRLLTRLGPNEWLYVGQYKLARSNPRFMTTEEWIEQSSKFQSKWAYKISVKDWGHKIRARILARRRLGREPTEEEVTATMLEGKLRCVTSDEIKRAFFEGKEKLEIFTMKCVWYDNDFQLELCSMA